MINIITDSTSDLGAEIARKYGLTVVPLLVTIGGKDYKDGVDIDQKTLFELVGKYGELPKTAAPSAGEFTRYFGQAPESLFIGISSKLSATIQNARLAAEMLPPGRVTVIDSLNLSTGVGLLAIQAAELRDQGCSAKEIVEAVTNSTEKVRTSFVIDTMDYLRKGGRCTAIQAIAGSMLKIHPIIEVQADGSLGVKTKARGSLQKGHQVMLDDLKMHMHDVDRRRIFVTHTCSDEATVKSLVEGVKWVAEPEEILVTRAGSVISSHCGPGTAGILYMTK